MNLESFERNIPVNKELLHLSKQVGELLISKGHSIGIAESSSGGLVSAHLLAVPGASKYFLGGSVIYTRFAQRGFLNVIDSEMDGLRAATEEYASLNAAKVKDLLGATWGLAETGATGPTGNRYGDAAGHSCIAVSGPSNVSVTLETGSSDREENMISFSKEALTLLLRTLSENLD